MIITRRRLTDVFLAMLTSGEVGLPPISDPISTHQHMDLAAAYISAVERLDAMLALDPRDTDEIANYIVLDDERLAILDRLVDLPAKDLRVLMAKAQVYISRAKMMGDDVDPLARSLALDVLSMSTSPSVETAEAADHQI